MRWDPDQYLKYADERFRPAEDLIAQIRLKSPSVIYDIGCGTGHLTVELAKLWPNAKIIGIDSSKEMLDVASTLRSKIEWQQKNIEDWEMPSKKPDLIFSNSVLHWLKNHGELFKKLINYLNKGGVLATQMPNNFKAPTHTTAFKIINDNNQWKDKLLPYLNKDPIHDIDFYYDVLAGSDNSFNAWETTYYHILNGKNPIVEWVKGSFLKPILDQLSANDQKIFLDKYTNEVSKFYPERTEGKTILPFKRLFFVVTKGE